jgi:hypothetical protein
MFSIFSFNTVSTMITIPVRDGLGWSSLGIKPISVKKRLRISHNLVEKLVLKCFYEQFSYILITSWMNRVETISCTLLFNYSKTILKSKLIQTILRSHQNEKNLIY